MRTILLMLFIPAIASGRGILRSAAAQSCSSVPATPSIYGTNYVVTDLAVNNGSAASSIFPRIGDGGQILVREPLAMRLFDYGASGVVVSGTDDQAPNAIARTGVFVGRVSSITPNAALWLNSTSFSNIHNSNPPNKPIGVDYASSLGRGVNSVGNVAISIGSWDSANSQWISSHSYLRAVDGSLTDVRPTPADTVTDGLGMNEQSTVVGYFNPSSSSADREAERAFRWTPTGGLVELPSLLSGGRSRAIEINNIGSLMGNVGLIVGWAKNINGDVNPVVWTDVTAPQIFPLNTLQGHNSGIAFGISDCNLAVGVSQSSASARAVVWELSVSESSGVSGPVRDLNESIPVAAGVYLERAVGINSQGHILALGWRIDSPNEYRAFLLRPNECPRFSPCTSDADGNGIVNFADITAVIAQFGSLCPP